MRRAQQTAVLAVTMVSIALLALGPWRTRFVAMAGIAGSGVVAAVVNGGAVGTPEGGELPFKLIATDDALTHHIEQTGRLPRTVSHYATC